MAPKPGVFDNFLDRSRRSRDGWFAVWAYWAVCLSVASWFLGGVTGRTAADLPSVLVGGAAAVWGAVLGLGAMAVLVHKHTAAKALAGCVALGAATVAGLGYGLVVVIPSVVLWFWIERWRV